MTVDFIRPLAPAERKAFIEAIARDSSLHAPFIVLVIASCAIATFGLIANSAAVIIGAMIVAPLMSPITAFAFGVVNADPRVTRGSLTTLAVGVALALAISTILSFVTGVPNYGSEILARGAPTLLDLGVALAAGFVAAYARVRSEISATLAGTAIAVALMPPVCTIGIGLAHFDATLARGAALLFVTNLLGIAFACMLAYALTGFASWERARAGLAWIAILVAVVAIPLGVSFARLLNQSRLEHAFQSALTGGTVTFRRVTIVATEFDWLDSPPSVELTVRAAEPITSTQVRLLEAYAKRETGVPFRLIFDVEPVVRVTGTTSSVATPTPPN